MSIESELILKMKEAMKSKDSVALTALRALKSAFLLAKTESGAKHELTHEQELTIVQKQVKQRKDSATIFKEQGREDLAEPELKEAAVLEHFLPKPLEEDAIINIIDTIINEIGAKGMKDMGKVMGLASKKMAGQAESSLIAKIVKTKLA